MTQQLSAIPNGVIASRNLDEVRTIVSQAFCDHRLDLPSGKNELDARIRIGRFAATTVVKIAYGAPVVIDPGRTDDFYLLRLVLSGRARIEVDQEKLTADLLTGTLINATSQIRILPSTDCSTVLFRINRKQIEDHLRSSIQKPVKTPLVFSPRIDLGSSDGARLHRFLRYLIDDVELVHPGEIESPLSGHFEQVLMTMLLQLIPNNYAHCCAGESGAISPRQVRRAIAFIEEHYPTPITSLDIARAAGVSVRTLSNGFRRFHQTTPMEFLRAFRLQKAHDLLKLGGVTESVTGAALQVGFGHPGRFAALYRAYFGHPPSETLRRPQ